MRKLVRFATILAGFLVSIVIVALVAQHFFFSSVVIKSSGTYDFEIGQTRKDVYRVAERLVSEGRAAEIHAWPDGEFHRPFRDGEIPTNDDSPRWTIVIDPNWWNNSVTLTFEAGRVVQIRRNRVRWELP